MRLENSITEEIFEDELLARGIQLFVKRDDLIDELISGNKWRKLKYNIELCRANKNNGILTFGGAYSNHLLATAAACNRAGLNAIGVVRGEELNSTSNDTLKKCAALGMKLVFISRELYGMRNEKAYHEELSYEFPNHHIVPEGGANYYGVIGCQEIMKEVTTKVDHVFIAQGTSTTSCGVLLSLNNTQKLHVVPVLKGYDAIQEMSNLLRRSGLEEDWVNDTLSKVEVLPEFHFGGYAKYTKELLNYIQNFYRTHSVKLDPVYTGKAMYALMHELKDARYNNTKILFIHTGGIQGAAAIEKQSGIRLYD